MLPPLISVRDPVRFNSINFNLCNSLKHVHGIHFGLFVGRPPLAVVLEKRRQKRVIIWPQLIYISSILTVSLEMLNLHALCNVDLQPLFQVGICSTQKLAIKAHLELWSRADKMVAVVLACHSWDPNGKFLMLMKHFKRIASAFWWRKNITAFLLLFLFRILCEYIPIFGYTKLYGIFCCLC
jgi:hypothetical protein